jgi:hypothetical protein
MAHHLPPRIDWLIIVLMSHLILRTPIKFGGLAQLVERLLCKQDVSGSSPLTSIWSELSKGRDERI